MKSLTPDHDYELRQGGTAKAGIQKAPELGFGRRNRWSKLYVVWSGGSVSRPCF
jgi:hypothetical protein